MLERALSSPKRLGARRDSDLYYYYAAFAQSFVEHKLIELNLPQESLVLDPWCGSGTTLAAARRYGHRSFGCDINPVSVVLSKSRFASTRDVDAVLETLDKALVSLQRSSKNNSRSDVLLWSLRRKILDDKIDRVWAAERYQSISARDALLATALFFFARQAANVTRSKNPSWRKNQTLARISLSQLRHCHGNLIESLENLKKTEKKIPHCRVQYHVAQINNESEPLSTGPIADAVITSPPYLTRLDYGVSTGLEWRLLKDDRDADLGNWRSSFTGSVLTYRTPTSVYPLPRLVGDLLSEIQRHDSKAARTYYFQFFRNYFVGVQNAIGNITHACKVGARGLFVVQDSQFKDLNIPLTLLFSRMLENCGWAIERTEPFSISPTFYRINPKRWAAEDFVRSENIIWARRDK
jgi:SAM-dependent methyltransferase